MNIFSTVPNRLILLRIYTLPSLLLIGALAYFTFNKGPINGLELIIASAVPLLIWCAMIYVVEYFHRDIDGRITISLIWSVIPFLIALGLSLIHDYRTLLFFVVIVGSTILYASKKNAHKLSAFSFIFRGLVELSMFLLVGFFYEKQLSLLFAPIGLIVSIYFITISRNLVGDIRDTKYDKFTFPKKYGTKNSYIVSGIVLLSAILFNNIWIAAPLIIPLVLIALQYNPYSLHKIFVISTVYFLVNQIAVVTGVSLILTNALFIFSLAFLFYESVPRKSNKDFIAIETIK